MVWHRKIASLDNLKKRGMVLANRCALCKRDLESVDHLFIHCPFAYAIWDRVSSKLSMFGPRNNSVRDLLEAWKGMNCTPTFAEASKVVIHGVFWYIWLERNARVFNDVRFSVTQVVARILFNIGRWLRATGLFSAADLSNWVLFIFDPG
ncbi:hypothetical protein LINPERHAP1_LOCUS16042 [Linum perenne]